MKQFRLKLPDGSWGYTVAPSLKKAKANFAFRLCRDGMYRPAAYEWAEDAEEVEP